MLRPHQTRIKAAGDQPELSDTKVVDLQSSWFERDHVSTEEIEMVIAFMSSRLPDLFDDRRR